MGDGVAEIPIEERAPEEVRVVHGVDAGGARAALDRFDAETTVSNFAFDVTPSRFVTGLITEHGVFEASPEGLAHLGDVHATSEG